MKRHTNEEVERASRRFAELADQLDSSDAKAESTEDLREIATVSEHLRADEVRLRAAVQAARARGRSWNEIAVALAVSRQAARQRFADKTPA